MLHIFCEDASVYIIASVILLHVICAYTFVSDETTCIVSNCNQRKSCALLDVSHLLLALCSLCCGLECSVHQ